MTTFRVTRALLSYAAAAIFSAGIAQAATINGTVFSTAPYPAPLDPSQTPSGTNFGSFTVDAINFFSPGGASTSGTGVGLTNIRERLKLLYGDRAHLVIEANQVGGAAIGTRVSITVPYQSRRVAG